VALAKHHRLQSAQSFTKVYRLGQRAGARCIAVKAFKPEKSVPGEGQEKTFLGTRFGVSISRKVSKKAVIRNRLKRQIHTAIQQLLPVVKPGWWVVITVRSAGVECEYCDFLRELEQLLAKLEVINGHS
jgi:ribonuclease P protein component